MEPEECQENQESIETRLREDELDILLLAQEIVEGVRPFEETREELAAVVNRYYEDMETRDREAMEKEGKGVNQ